MISPRENALRTIRFEQPEYVMTDLPLQWLTYHGCNHEGYEGGGHHLPVGSRWTDIWGTQWEREHEGVMGFAVANPLDSVEKLAGYQWPSADDPRICGKIEELAAAPRNTDLLLAGQHRDTLWEKAYMLVGMERVMEAFYMEPEFTREVLRRIMDFQLAIAQKYAAKGIEVALLGDDLGTQRGPLMSPALVDEFLRPEYVRIFSFYRERGVICWFHSCGCVGAFLEMLMELGVKVLNPVQASANDMDALRRQTAGRMALHGGVSTAVMMDGPVERIEAEVRQRLWQLGRDGGYFCAPDQGMPFPPGHYEAYKAAVAKYGRYPLTPG